MLLQLQFALQAWLEVGLKCFTGMGNLFKQVFSSALSTHVAPVRLRSARTVHPAALVFFDAGFCVITGAEPLWLTVWHHGSMG